MKKLTFRHWLGSLGVLRMSMLISALAFQLPYIVIKHTTFFMGKDPLVLSVQVLITLGIIDAICFSIVIVECLRVIGFSRFEALTLKKHFILVIVLILVVGSFKFITAPYKAKSYYNYGWSLIEAQRYNEALRALNIAIVLSPSYASAYHERCYVYYQLGNYSVALADCNKAIKLALDNASNYNIRGRTYYYLGNYKNALDDFNKAISLNPNLETSLKKWIEGATQKIEATSKGK